MSCIVELLPSLLIFFLYIQTVNVRIRILLKIYTCVTVQTYNGKFPLSYFQLAGWLSEYDCPVIREAVLCCISCGGWSVVTVIVW